jgi:hypothetical protein
MRQAIHEGLGDAVALRAFERSEAGIQIQGESNVDGLPKRASAKRTIMSRIDFPESPTVVAVQPITSRSWQSRTMACAGSRTRAWSGTTSRPDDRFRDECLNERRFPLGGS